MCVLGMSPHKQCAILITFLYALSDLVSSAPKDIFHLETPGGGGYGKADDDGSTSRENKHCDD